MVRHSTLAGTDLHPPMGLHPTPLDLPTSQANAYRIRSPGGQTVLNMSTSTANIPQVTFGEASANGGVTYGIYLNDSSLPAFLVADEDGVNSYIRINTGGSPSISLGNTTDDPPVIVITDAYFAIQNATRDARMSISGNAFVLNTETDIAVQVGQLTTAQRDALTASNGMLLYNTTSNELQARINGAWVALGSGGGATTLDGLSDVVITSPATGQVLRYNGTNWVNADIPNTRNVSFEINNDGAAGTAENPNLVLTGGDGGTDLVQTNLIQDSANEITYLTMLRNLTGIPMTFGIGGTTTASRGAELRFQGGTGTNAQRARFGISAAGGTAVFYQQEDNAGGGTFGLVNSVFRLGDDGSDNVTTRTTELQIGGSGDGATYHPLRIVAGNASAGQARIYCPTNSSNGGIAVYNQSGSTVIFSVDPQNIYFTVAPTAANGRIRMGVSVANNAIELSNTASSWGLLIQKTVAESTTGPHIWLRGHAAQNRDPSVLFDLNDGTLPFRIGLDQSAASFKVSAATQLGTSDRLILGGDAATPTSAGGASELRAGNGGSTSGAGGPITIAAGNAVGSGFGGAATLSAGNAMGTNNNGGDVTVVGGAGSSGGQGGAAVIAAGASAGTNVAGAQTQIRGGRGTGSGNGGAVVIQTAPAGASGSGVNALRNRLIVDSDGDVTLTPRGNGQSLGIRAITELHNLALANTSDTTIQIPAGALVLYVTVRETVNVTTSSGTNTFSLGVAGDATRYGGGIGGPSHVGIDSGGFPRFYSAATAIRISAPGAETFTAGQLRVTVHYVDCAAAAN